jgi:hypothetical protein
MTHEEICTYEVCKLAKDKGFNCKVYNYYQATKYYSETLRGIELHSECWKLETDDCYICYNKGSEAIASAPTQSLLQRWLREEKGIVVEVIAQPTCSTSKKNCYWWSIKQNSDGICYQYEECSYLLYSDEGYFDTYELALEDALKYALENLV